MKCSEHLSCTNVCNFSISLFKAKCILMGMMYLYLKLFAIKKNNASTTWTLKRKVICQNLLNVSI